MIEIMRDLDRLDQRIGRLEALEVSGGSGTTFPTGIAAGFRWFRPDLGWWCYYDGSRWLTLNDYVLNLKVRSATALADIPIRTDYAPYVTRVATTTNVATTNNASNYYTITIQSVNLALSAADTVYSFTTAADSVGVETPHEGAPTGQPNSNRAFLRYIHSVTLGAPGTITSAATVYYRLIIP